MRITGFFRVLLSGIFTEFRQPSNPATVRILIFPGDIPVTYQLNSIYRISSLLRLILSDGSRLLNIVI